MKSTIKFLIAGVLCALLLGACSDLLEPDSATGGNVTITLDTGHAGRTIRPSDITATSAFERIELEFIKDGGVIIQSLNKGTTSYTTSLEAGTWTINVRGFMKIGEREYEAAQGSAVITVTASGSHTVPIALQTGILGDKPGVFSYNIGFPSNVTEAILEITPLPDRFGYEVIAAGKTVDLMLGKTGSCELLPGYYLLTLTAKAAATMAVWNELVHIYSGRETAAPHTFAAGDFIGTVTLSGTVNGGEFEGNHITGALVTAYGDENLLNRIASVNISGFTEMTTAPFGYSAPWSITVPNSLVGKDLYFCVEETLGGRAGTRTQVWNNDLPITVLSDGTPIELNTSYTWGKWIENGNNNAVNYAVAADGTVTVITTEAVAHEWDNWRQVVSFNFPAENAIRYAYEFEAWTSSGERPLSVQHILNSKYELYLTESFTINATRRTFTLISDTRFDSDVRRQLTFLLGHTATGTLYIKIKTIKPATEYLPPAVGDSPRFTATAASGGIRLKADLRGLPDKLRGLMFFQEDANVRFSSPWGWSSERPDFYEILFPYVQVGKEYTFRLEYEIEGSVLGSPRATATATGGRGELVFTNASELAVVKEGNTIKFNKTPLLSSAFNEPNAVDKQYAIQIASGTSWVDPLVEWRYSHVLDDLKPFDLIEVLPELDEWVDTSGFLGKTCFADIYYSFEYDNDDIYLLPQPDQHQRGSFVVNAASSTPFTYPNVLPAIFTALAHSEGVKLTVDLTRIPASTTSLYFFETSNKNANLWLSSDEWSDNYWGSGRFYGQDTIEIIYPFVQAGNTYTFQVNYEGTGAIGQDTVTATAGLGALYITNAADLGLIYSSATKTLSLTSAPVVSSLGNSPKIGSKEWGWYYYKGYNWVDSEWKGASHHDELVTSVVLDNTLVLDNTFDPYIIKDLSNTIGFVNVLYFVSYEGFSFQCEVATSSPFRFPYFDPMIAPGIGTAFDTNSALYLNYYDTYVERGNPLYVAVTCWVNDYNSISYTWFIDGVLQTGVNNEENLPTTGLSLGIHYGLVVVTIDGATFAKEFTFWVWD